MRPGYELRQSGTAITAHRTGVCATPAPIGEGREGLVGCRLVNARSGVPPHRRIAGWVLRGLPAALALTGLAAADAPSANVRPAGWECRWCPKVPEQSAELTVGAAYVSDSSAKFGEYRGLGDEGGYAIVDGDASYRGDGARYAEISTPGVLRMRALVAMY